MARFDRCRLCNYAEATGSELLGVSPGGHGKVRRYAEDYMCDRCSAAVDQARADLRPPVEVDEELELLGE